ncbi:UNVERIFIED_ORG: hypothetical protein E4P37_19655 [Bacillus sp. AZ43]
MDIPVTAGPWLTLGAVLGILLALGGAAAVLLLRRRPGGTAGGGPVEDDLAAFLESPPGTDGAPLRPAAGWAVLAPPPPAPDPAPERHRTARALAAMAAAGLVLVGGAAAVAAVRSGADPAEPATSAAPAAPAALAAELTFAGVVLERHAVGVTVGYPRLRVTGGDGGAVAGLELPTFNCLRDDAPEDPLAAGCTASVVERAELSTPRLRVRGDADGLHLTGEFATTRSRSGADPVPTGRVHAITVRAAAADGRAGPEPEPAVGELELGGGRVPTAGPGPNEISVAG